MTDHLVVGTEIRDPSPVAPTKQRQTIWLASIGIGSILSIVGGYELARIWISAELGNLSWEVGAIANTFPGMLAPTAGLALLGAGLLKSSYEMAAKVLAIIFLAIAAFLAGILFIYIVDMPAALRNANASGTPQNSETIITFALAAVLIGFYSWGAWFLRSRTKRIY